MDNCMTELSNRSFNMATSGKMSVKEAIAFLENETKLRSLRDKLEKVGKGRDLKKVLVNGLLENHPEMQKESVERRVRGWMNDESVRTLRKKDAIEICFILDLSFEEADAFIASVSEEKLHWRDPDEIVMIYALLHGLSFRQASELQIKASELFENRGNMNEANKDCFTSLVRSEISALRTEDELLSYIKESGSKLGSLHNKAFDMFTEMMDRLSEIEENEYAGLAGEHLSVRQILTEYLHEGSIPVPDKTEKKQKKENVDDTAQIIKKMICSNWPEETAISKMKSRSIDVSRKVLILLFIATCDWDSDDDEYEPTREELFDDIYGRINDFLNICGFSALDPRSPFDWLIIYCICVPDLYMIDEKMRRMLKVMFD